MHIVLLCATNRGLRFLETLANLLPSAQLTVFSFREEAYEPPFLDAIKTLAVTHGSQFFETRQVGGQRWLTFWESTVVDLMFVVSWRYLIPSHIYRRPRRGTFVFHDSLLPEYRGFSPTVWAIANGEDHTGVTLFEIGEEIDTGPIVDQERVPIQEDDTITTVMQQVTQKYLHLLERNLNSLLDGNVVRIPQDHSRATYACKRLPDDNRIDWTSTSERIYNLIRATTMPYSGAFTFLAGKKVRVWAAERVTDMHHYVGRIPGRVIEVHPGKGSMVLTGDGALMLTQVQEEQSEIVCAANVMTSIKHTLG